MIISASEIKKHGVSIFDKLFEKVDSIVVNVRGKNKYVVMDMGRYNELREYELQKAYEEVTEDIKGGDYQIVSAKEHINELKKSLKNV